MAHVSLQGSIMGCKVDVGWANRLQTDRIINPAEMMCPVWSGYDLSGRPVCADSFWTKRAGCNSAGDRINVENDLRPQYMEYVTLDAQGIRGQSCPAQGVYQDTVCASQAVKSAHQYTGQFGYNTGFTQNIKPNCQTCRNVPDNKAIQSNGMRQGQWINMGNQVQQMRRNSGM